MYVVVHFSVDIYEKIILFSFYSGYTPLNFSRNEAIVNIIFLLARCGRKSYAIMTTMT